MGKKKWKKFVYNIPYLMGTPGSILVHTLLFLFAFILIGLGVNADRVMLTLTTVVSLEAIYLTLLLQMSVNRQQKHIKDIREDVDDILEDTEELTDDK